MNKKKIKVVYEPGATNLSMPREGDIGIDLYANKDMVVKLNQTALIPTGVKVEMPKGYALVLKDRSSVSKYCHVLAGVCDNSYRGEIFVRMYCHTSEKNPNVFQAFLVKKGDKIAQALIVPDLTQEFEIIKTKELSDTNRGEGGFGSTGK